MGAGGSIRKIAGATALALSAGACAPSAVHFGDAGLPVPPEPESFAMADSGDAAAAVRKALGDLGFEEREDARLRIDVGFAVRPRELAVTAPGEDTPQVLSPAGKRKLALCERQAYVLTLSFIERPSGRMIARSGATISLCEGSPERVLPQLARTALPFS